MGHVSDSLDVSISLTDTMIAGWIVVSAVRLAFEIGSELLPVLGIL